MFINYAQPYHPAIAPHVRSEIMHRLRSVEREHNVLILMAVESGSRAWGFASENSDYDVRFIYVRDPSWYCSIDVEDRPNVIEHPIVDEIDLNGWDLRKALRLYDRSNPAFIEWVQSPIRYIDIGSFQHLILSSLSKIYSIKNGLYHYRSTAKHNHRKHLLEPEVVLKKYFYTLRPLLAVLWIEQCQCPPPIEFDKLLLLIKDRQELHADILSLLELKKRSPELGRGSRIESIDRFIVSELKRLQDVSMKLEQKPETLVMLNTMFTQLLSETRPQT